MKLGKYYNYVYLFLIIIFALFGSLFVPAQEGMFVHYFFESIHGLKHF
jgi:hypothetical protein